MREPRYRSAWIWVAITAIAIAPLVRAQAGGLSARALAHPVLEFLAAHQSAPLAARTGVPRRNDRLARRDSAWFGSAVDSGVWAAMLPVLFIGLVAPLTLLPAGALDSLALSPSRPFLPCRFQRPPPLRLA